MLDIPCTRYIILIIINLKKEKMNTLSNLPTGYTEEEAPLTCPKCGGTMYIQEDMSDGLLLVKLECEDCGHSVNNEEDLC